MEQQTSKEDITATSKHEIADDTDVKALKVLEEKKWF